MKPTLGRIVLYRGETKEGKSADGYVSEIWTAPAIVTHVYETGENGEVDLTVFTRWQTQTLERIPCSGYEPVLGHWHWPLRT